MPSQFSGYQASHRHRQAPVPFDDTVSRVDHRLDDLILVGFNSRVVALDRDRGTLVWSWKAPQGTGFVALHLDRDLLIASVYGYTYALDPLSGKTLWSNMLKGFGVGIPCIASISGSTIASSAVAEAAAEAARQSSTD